MKTVDFRTPKQKLEDAGRFVKRKAREGLNWAKENEVLLAITVPAITAIVAGSVKAIGRTVNNHRAEVIKNQYIYDPKLGFYWPTKRPLNAAEKLEYSRRYKNGENGGDILRRMKLLKL